MSTASKTVPPGGKEWMKLINQWREEEYSLSPMSWQDVLVLEAEDGESKRRYTVEKALKYKGSWAERWFASGQTDYSPYSEIDYVFSTMFCHFHITRRNVRMAIDDIVKSDVGSELLISDYGGTIFTAMETAYLLPDSIVSMFNYPGPQIDFAKWVLKMDRFDGVNIETRDADMKVPQSDVVFAFETFEHIQSPEKTFEDIVRSANPKLFYFANLFCYPAYGHHIPITINGANHTNRVSANKAWRKALSAMGKPPRKIKGFNSRLWVSYG